MNDHRLWSDDPWFKERYELIDRMREYAALVEGIPYARDGDGVISLELADHAEACEHILVKLLLCLWGEEWYSEVETLTQELSDDGPA
jgi:hypothetical protein